MMKKIFLSLAAGLICFGISLVGRADASFTAWSNASVDSISSTSMQSMACDVTSYTQVYLNYYGLILDYFTNTASVSDYLWRYKSFTYGSHILYNASTYPGKDTGIVIFNRNHLAANGWKVLP